MKSAYCTILSKSRLYQFLALILSLNKSRNGNFRFFVLCVDEQVYRLLEKLKWENITLVHENELTADILALKGQRKLHEYCWSLKASFLENILLKYPDVMRVTYMDSDLYFYDDPEKIFMAQPDCSILLTREEKYNPSWKPGFVKRLTEITGEYNSGFISFKRDVNSLSCLKWWKSKLIESCKIDPKNGKFADQKYLDEMPELFTNICDIATPGINIGPWNYLKYSFALNNGKVFLDNQIKLVFYHFSGVRIVNKNEIRLVHNDEEKIPFIYKDYKHVIRKLITMVEMVQPQFDGFAKEEDLKSYW